MVAFLLLPGTQSMRPAVATFDSVYVPPCGDTEPQCPRMTTLIFCTQARLQLPASVCLCSPLHLAHSSRLNNNRSTTARPAPRRRRATRRAALRPRPPAAAHPRCAGAAARSAQPAPALPPEGVQEGVRETLLRVRERKRVRETQKRVRERRRVR
ncbi:hypothetical protein T492DRAFT_367536 [Pavlovales sp. CCMP2436]|nr:hypothetical protein T492DRAFT_367536 [Pavlovales sp. CCMP2436]